MKKLLMVLLATILTFGVTACSDKSEPADGAHEEADSEAQNDETNEESDEKELPAEEIYKKALEVSADMESAEVSLLIKQNVEIPSEDFSMETESDLTMEMTMDPLAVYQKGTTTALADGETEEMGQEMYITDEGIYFSVEEGDMWIKMDDSMIDATDVMDGQEVDPAEQLKMIEQFTDELEFEESDDEYTLKLTADGKEFMNLVNDLLDGFLPEDLEESDEDLDEIMENTEINDMSYEIIIDKESFEMTAFNMDMDMVMEEEGEEVHLVQNMASNYSKINEIDKIEVPQDVIDSAINEDEVEFE